MRIMAVLSVLVGTLEGLNVIAELVAGLSAGRTVPGSLLLAVPGLAAVVLLVSGVVLFTRGPRAVRVAGASVIASLVLFAGTAVFAPVLSMAALVLGIGYPIAMLVVLSLTPHAGAAAGAP